MNYIVLDLEWNQGNEEKEKQRKDIPFEIIEIGAIKLDGRMEFGGSFHEVVKPQVYQEMHRMTRQLLHMDCLLYTSRSAHKGQSAGLSCEAWSQNVCFQSSRKAVCRNRHDNVQNIPPASSGYDTEGDSA